MSDEHCHGSPEHSPPTNPGVGDEVEYAPGLLAIVTDIRRGVPYLRSGPRQWPVDDTSALRVRRSRERRISEGDVW
ncbi:hypothetical protein ACIBK8_16970 [Streptomyces sp. NPDC050161]|uniref:hypothetical protein n=1 Tax=Streptomyces sp. NPDC050161 TaxID=3365604 RepID=UPI00379EBC88